MASWSLAATFVHFGYFVFYIPMLNSGLEIVRLTHIFADSYFLSLCNITKNKHRFISRKEVLNPEGIHRLGMNGNVPTAVLLWLREVRRCPLRRSLPIVMNSL